MRLLSLTLVLIMLSYGVIAGDSYSKTDRVSGGSLTETNTHEDAAYELKHVMFTLPQAWTNTFQIRHIRTYKLPDTKTTLVTTSEVINPVTGSGWIETNTIYRAQGVITFTNTVAFLATTNDTSTQVYDVDDIPTDWFQEWNDIFIFIFTATNAFDLIRNYDIHNRP